VPATRTAPNFAWSRKKTATLYRVTAPANPVLVRGNRLCGAKGPQPVPLTATAISPMISRFPCLCRWSGFAVRFGSVTGEVFPGADRVMAAQC
jgi:hypothetical protein